MENSSPYPRLTGKDNRKGGRAGRNTSSRSPSAKEIENEGRMKMRTQKGKKDNTQLYKEPHKQVEVVQGPHQVPTHRNQVGIRGQLHR